MCNNKTIKSLINAQHLRHYHDPRPLRRRDIIVENQDEKVAEPETQQDPEVINNSQSSASSDTLDTGAKEDETMNEVERLLGKKMMNRKLHYKCKWSAGSPPSWEPVGNIDEKLLEDFHIKFTQKGTRRKKRNRQSYKYFNRT